MWTVYSLSRPVHSVHIGRHAPPWMRSFFHTASPALRLRGSAEKSVRQIWEAKTL